MSQTAATVALLVWIELVWIEFEREGRPGRRLGNRYRIRDGARPTPTRATRPRR